MGGFDYPVPRLAVPMALGLGFFALSAQMLMRSIAVVAFLVALAAAPPVAAAWPWSSGPELSASLCQAPETALFTCKVGTRTVSICGQEQGGAVYRFGRRGHMELEVGDLHLAHDYFPSGGETQVYGDTGTHRYIVYDGIMRTRYGSDGLHYPQAYSGLLVQSSGEIVSSRTCAEPTTFNPLINTLPEGEYTPH